MSLPERIKVFREEEFKVGINPCGLKNCGSTIEIDILDGILRVSQSDRVIFKLDNPEQSNLVDCELVSLELTVKRRTPIR